MSEKNDEEYYQRDSILYLKYEFEECKNINDILVNIDELKKLLEYYKKKGYRLKQEVKDGYCYLSK